MQIPPVLLLLILFISCNEGESTSSKIERAEIIQNDIRKDSSAQPKTKATVDDPYFVVSKDTVSTKGPNSITRNVLQARSGMYWFATWEGIICYDGKVFTNVTLKEGLRRFHVFSLLEDKAGNLWFGTIGGGLYRYDGKQYKLYTTADGLANDNILCMMEDISGNVWIGTGNGASRFNTEAFINYTTNDGLNNNTINTIAQDRKGKLWFGTDGGISIFSSPAIFSKNPSTNGNANPSSNVQGSFTDFTNKEKKVSFHNVRSILADKSGNIWIASAEGLNRYDGKSLTNFSKNFTSYLFEDRSGNLWLSGSVGNAGGMTLTKYDRNSFIEILVKNDQKNSFNNQIFGITEDVAGNIWFGTATGVCRYDTHLSPGQVNAITNY